MEEQEYPMFVSERPPGSPLDALVVSFPLSVWATRRSEVAVRFPSPELSA